MSENLNDQELSVCVSLNLFKFILASCFVFTALSRAAPFEPDLCRFGLAVPAAGLGSQARVSSDGI